MPRFTDNWVVDRTMFEYVSGGSCACCGLNHLFMPDGLKGLINDISDLETDAADAEFKAAQKSPWPPDMRDQVWADRVKLRYKMKKEMKEYKSFMVEVGGKDGFKSFCRDKMGPSGIRRVLQMPRGEISDRLNSRYGIHSAFAIVLCAVVEQVANVHVTGFPPDGRSDVELAFEEALKFDRRGGFVLPVARKRDPETREFVIDEDALDHFADLMLSLGGPKLLHRAPKKKVSDSGGGSDDDNDDEGEGADDAAAEGETVPGQEGPSFRSDRRIVRLLIARYWADQVIAKYRMHAEAEEKKMKEAESGGDEASDGPAGGEQKSNGTNPSMETSSVVKEEASQLSSEMENLSTSP